MYEVRILFLGFNWDAVVGTEYRGNSVTSTCLILDVATISSGYFWSNQWLRVVLLISFIYWGNLGQQCVNKGG